MGCDSNLPNPGSGDCPLVMSEIRRFMFVAQIKEDGTENYISQADAAAIANWQTLFDKPAFGSDFLEKVVPTNIIFGAMSEQDEAAEYNEGGFYKKLADGTYFIKYKMIDVVAQYLKEFKVLENRSIAVYLADNDSRIWGKDDGTDLYPLKIGNIKVPDFQLQTREAPSMVEISFTIENPDDMNDLISVTVADGNVHSDSDFYSLIDATGTVSSPAITGCQVIAITDRHGDPITGIVWGDVAFRDQATPFTAYTLASTDKWDTTDQDQGIYIADETALLTAGKTYTLELAHDGYDITCGDVVVPA